MSVPAPAPSTDPPVSPWFRQVQGAVNRGDLREVATFAPTTTTPVDAEAFCLAIRVGSPNLVNLLLPLVQDKGSDATQQVFDSWRTRIGFSSSSFTVSDNLVVLQSLMAAGFKPPLTHIAQSLFASQRGFSRPNPNQPLTSNTNWEHLTSAQNFWIKQILPQTPLPLSASLPVIRAHIFPSLVANPPIALRFFSALKSRPHVFRLARHYFKKEYATELWHHFFIDTAKPSPNIPSLKLQYKLLSKLFPCPAEFTYQPVAPRGKFSQPFQVSSLTFCVINRCASAVELLTSLGHLPELLADVARLAPVLIKAGSSEGWYFPYLNPAEINFLSQPVGANGHPLLFAMFTHPEISINPQVHRFLVHNLDACRNLRPSGVLHSFLDYYQTNLKKQPQVILLDVQYQPREILSLSNYALRLNKESLDLKITQPSNCPDFSSVSKVRL